MSLTEEKAYELMKGAYERGRLAHAYLISGPTGSGKRSLAARVIELVNPADQEGGMMGLWGEPEEPVVAKTLDELQGEFLNLVRPRSKSRRIPIDDIRALEHTMQMAAPRAKWKVGVVVDADRMFDEAANAFLKTLEEPPSGCLLMLLTAGPEGLLPTIRSRCVNVTLRSAGRQELLSAEESVMLARLLGNAGAKRSAKNALLVKAGFEALLSARRAEVEERYAAAFKEESATYKKATDGTWLDEREKFYAAMAESDYLAARTGLVDMLVGWFGDAVRHNAGVPGLGYPEHAKHTARFAESDDLEGLLRRLDALQEMRESLHTNAQEALMLEVSFLKAFG
jgi:DNA polymerase-3 subunit delta'